MYTHLLQLTEGRRIYASIGVENVGAQWRREFGQQDAKHDYVELGMAFWPGLVMRLEPSAFNQEIDRLAVHVEAALRRWGFRPERRS